MNQISLLNLPTRKRCPRANVILEASNSVEKSTVAMSTNEVRPNLKSSSCIRDKIEIREGKKSQEEKDKEKNIEKFDEEREK